MPYKPTGRPPGRPRHPESLTPAEQRVLRYLRQGRTNTEIADALDVSADAVKYHVSNMLGKLELENREQLAAWREPSAVKRAWAAMGGLGWKLAGGAAALVVATGVGVGGWLLLRGDGSGTEPADLSDLATGVLSVGIDGQPANGPSLSPSISDDGRFVAFESEATNLVKDDTNGVSDIFVVDRADRSIRRVSLAPGGKEANGASHRPAISGDGKWVAFDSEASNLVKDDVNGELDRVLAHVSEGFIESFGDNSDGRDAFVAQRATWAGSDVFVVELKTKKVDIVSLTTSGERGDLGSFWPTISRDGRYVAFESSAPNLVGEVRARLAPPAILHVSGFSTDVFVRDRDRRTTTRISIGNDGTKPFMSSVGPVITPDGRFLSFVSGEPALAGPRQRQILSGYVWSRDTGKLRVIPDPEFPSGMDSVFVVEFSRIALSADGTTLAYQATFGLSNTAREQTDLRGCFAQIAGEDASRVVDSTAPECTVSAGANAPALLDREVVYPTASGGGVRTYALDTRQTAVTSLPTGFDALFQPAAASGQTGKWIVGTSAFGAWLDADGQLRVQVVVLAR